MTSRRPVGARVRSALGRSARPIDVSASPAYFDAYVRRESWLERGFPEEWANRADLPLVSDARVAAVLHVFYPDLLDELIGHLAAIPVPFDLMVTSSSGVGVSVDAARMPQLQRCAILQVENRGRDLWPLAQVVNAGLLDRYDLVVKVHTKRSDWRGAHARLGGTGGSWRNKLLSALLGDPANVIRIMDAFAASPDLGMVTADGSVLGPEFWGQDEPVTATLLRRLELEIDPDDLEFAAGSMYWSRGIILQGLKDMHLSAADFEDEQHQVDGTTAHALERVIGLLAHGAGLRIVERSQLADASLRAVPSTVAASGLTPVPDLPAGSPAVVAFYLPQYHPIPENDEWWGPGFTDWVKVRDARPLYPGHPVPHVPADLGYYDLRLREVRERQAELARSHGIYGFCYYFYWFGGRRLLEQPLELMLADGQPDLPFCLCWANEPWSRRWDGRQGDVLMAQHHDRIRDLAVVDDLLPFFEDQRYIRIDGRPLLLIYRQGLLDDPVSLTADLREEAVRRGLPGLFLCHVMSIGDREQLAAGFDAAVEFPPNGVLVTDIDPREIGADPAFRGRIYDYESVVASVLARPTNSFPYFPGVMPRWDNSARKGLAAHVFHGSTPELFERWLRRAGSISTRKLARAPLVFVNSWNEWAEGAHLEPDERSGRQYLEAIRRVVLADVSHESEGTGHAAADSPAQASADVPMAILIPGMPNLDDAVGATVEAGTGWIDSVNGAPLHGHVVSVDRDGPLWLRGWFSGDPRRSGRRGDHGYLILSSEGSAWHAPVERHRRADLQRAMLARDRTTRRLVRSIDRLPPSIGRRILRLWAGRHDFFGFDLRLQLSAIPIGSYDIGFLDLTASGPRLIGTELVLRVR